MNPNHPHKREINYLYFGFFLFTLSLLSIFHYKGQPLTAIPLFFLLYAIVQALLEVCVFVLITYILSRWAPRWSQFLFISVSFVFLLLHYTNFTMVRLLDTSISYLFKFFFYSGIDHFIAGFQAMNLNWKMIFISFGTFLAIPLVGLGFHWLTSLVIKKKPLPLSLTQITIAISVIGSSLLILDILIHPHLSGKEYEKYTKTLPLGTTFLSPNPKYIHLEKPLAKHRDEKQLLQQLPKATLAHRPNIYFFVIETLRKDFLYAAPNLTKFGKDHIQFQSSFANANCTHLSWFALFHSNLPFYWTAVRDEWTKGAIPLQILKNLGYKIHVYSSADLRYFGMDKLLFGDKRELADKIEEYTFDREIKPCDRDALAFKSLQEQDASEGQAYLIFLDSTHSEYSFPEDFPLKYEPISKNIDYLTIGPNSPELERIKNRYRNSISYIDQLMGTFFKSLKDKSQFDDAIIAVTGDHGEEFFEEGALFHGTHLNDYQTSVPIFFKFPSKDWVAQTDEATHIDLFPSILHYLTKQSDFSALFDGKSIFSLKNHPYRVAVLQNGPDAPTEFTVTQSDLTLRSRLTGPQRLEIIEMQGALQPNTLSPLLEKF